MHLLDPLQRALVITFLVSAMLSIGMAVTTADLRDQVARRGLRWRTLLANFVIVPAIGILLSRLVVSDRGTARAFVLLACTPGGISALQFATKAKDAAAYAGVTACLLSLLAVPLAPLLLALALPAAAVTVAPLGGTLSAGTPAMVSPGILLRALAFLAAFLVVPMFLGMVAKSRAEAICAKVGKGLGLVSALSFVVLVVLLMAPRKDAIQQIGGQAAGWLLVLVLAAMLVGWVLGGPETGTRQVLASATSMRNAALALALAVNLPDADTVVPVLVAFSALMVPPNLLLTVACLIANRRRARVVEPGPRGSSPVAPDSRPQPRSPEP